MNDALARLGRVCAWMPPARKNAKSHQSKYLDLPGLLAHVTPELKKEALTAVCEATTDDHGRIGVRYLFIGPDDVHETPWLWLGPARDAQHAGGLVTYGQRYVLAASCGVPQQETVEHEKRTPQPKTPPKKTAGGSSGVRGLQIAFGQAGIQSREDRLAYASQVVGRELESSKDLTPEEIGQVRAKLSRHASTAE